MTRCECADMLNLVKDSHRATHPAPNERMTDPIIKRIALTLTLAFGMLAVTTEGASAAPANPDSSREAVEFCKSEVGQQFIESVDVTMGECVNLVAGAFTNNAIRFHVGRCGEEITRERLGFANKGECIAGLQVFIRP